MRNIHAARMYVFLSESVDLRSATLSVYTLSLFLKIYVILTLRINPICGKLQFVISKYEQMREKVSQTVL
jgi:hypothetical protein